MKCVGIVIWVLAAILGAPMTPASGQMITTACTSSLISSFTPCLNFLSGSTNDGGSPTAECCRSVASLVSSSTECACLILTGNVPFSLPITRTLAILLPRLCRSPVPLQCTGTATTLPGPGPVAFSPSLPPLPPMQSEPLPPLPAPTSPLEPTSPSLPLEPASLSPSSPLLEPASPPAVIGDANQGRRPIVLPSSAMKPSHNFTTSILPLLVLGVMLFDK